MKYPIVVHNDPGSAYGVTVPDIPGCFSAGDSYNEALENAIEAIEFHLETLAEDECNIPKPSEIDAHVENEEYQGGIWGFVEIDATPFLGKNEKINVTLPSILIRKIDSQHKNRSKFLAEAAIRALAS